MKRIIPSTQIACRVLVVFGIVSAVFLVSCIVPANSSPGLIPDLNPTRQVTLTVVTLVPTMVSTPTNSMPSPTPIIASSPTPSMSVVMPWAVPSLDSSPGTGSRLDLDKIFPPGEVRAFVITRCTICHRYGILVRGQRSVARWEAIKWSHRSKAGLGGEEDLKTMFEYLEVNFNPSHPEPELPPWFLLEEGNPEW